MWQIYVNIWEIFNKRVEDAATDVKYLKKGKGIHSECQRPIKGLIGDYNEH